MSNNNHYHYIKKPNEQRLRGRAPRASDRPGARYDPSVDRQAFLSAWQARAEGGQGEVQAFVPNYAGSPLVFGEPGARSSAVGEHDYEAKAGYHLAPLPIDGECEIYAGSGFTLIALDSNDATVRGFELAARELGVPLHVIESARTPDNCAWGADLILVRPDAFVAFAGETADETPREILLRAVGNTQ